MRRRPPSNKNLMITKHSHKDSSLASSSISSKRSQPAGKRTLHTPDIIGCSVPVSTLNLDSPKILTSAISIEPSSGGNNNTVQPHLINHPNHTSTNAHTTPKKSRRRSSMSSTSTPPATDVSISSSSPSVTAHSERPSIPYAGIIAQAIITTPGAYASLKCIYAWITETYRYFQTATKTWQNSIRHNLTNEKNFVKLGSDTDGNVYFAIMTASLLQFENKNYVPQGTYNLLHTYISRLIEHGPVAVPRPPANVWPVVKSGSNIVIRFAPSSSSSKQHHQRQINCTHPDSNNNSSRISNENNRSEDGMHNLMAISPQKFHHGMPILPCDIFPSCFESVVDGTDNSAIDTAAYSLVIEDDY